MGDGELLVLVVDGSTETADLWTKALMLAGLAVATATSAVDGLRQAARLSPAAIVTELNLPDMTGEDFIRELKKRDRAIPIIALTAQPWRWDARRAQQLGCDALLIKPCRPERLVSTVLGSIDRRNGSVERRRIPRGGRRTTDPGARHRRRAG